MQKPSNSAGYIYTSLISLLVLVAAVVLIMLSTTAAQAETGSLTSFIQSSLGVNQQQAAGGAGILLEQAQTQLQPNQFKQLSQYIPDISQLISAAPKAGGGSTLENKLELPLNSISGLSDISLTDIITRFQSLGLNADMPLKFGTAIQQYIRQTGGDSASSLLIQALPATLQ